MYKRYQGDQDNVTNEQNDILHRVLKGQKKKWSLCMLLSLHDDVLVVCLRHMGLKDVCRLSMCCRSFQHTVVKHLRSLSQVSCTSVGELAFAVEKCTRLTDIPEVSDDATADVRDDYGELPWNVLDRWPDTLYLNFDIFSAATLQRFMDNLSRRQCRCIEICYVVARAKPINASLHMRHSLDLNYFRVQSNYTSVRSILTQLSCRSWHAVTSVLCGPIERLSEVTMALPYVSRRLWLANTLHASDSDCHCDMDAVALGTLLSTGATEVTLLNLLHVCFPGCGMGCLYARTVLEIPHNISNISLYTDVCSTSMINAFAMRKVKLNACKFSTDTLDLDDEMYKTIKIRKSL